MCSVEDGARSRGGAALVQFRVVGTFGGFLGGFWWSCERRETMLRELREVSYG